jgi:hypothetical protein
MSFTISKHEAVRMQEVVPQAGILIESMRDIGYSLGTALADIVDNAISANATIIQILTNPGHGEQSLAILDDGIGMSENELVMAMRPGSKNPLEPRAAKDLGRFGLGLKTASFSQCRKLTVMSRKDGKTSCARWDLDKVALTNKWMIELLADVSGVPWADRLSSSGTLVVWQNLDRLMEEGSKDGQTDFAPKVDEAADHLSLVFHRFLAKEKGARKVHIMLNGRDLKPFDPFNSSHAATQLGPKEIVKCVHGEVVIQSFTLPHHSKDPDNWELYGGKAGYLKNQGFYVYREKRLIIHGTWFGLAKQSELTKLSRVRIDIPNGMDSEWKIDVKKASAQPPATVRKALRRVIEKICETSRRVYQSKGHILANDSQFPLWHRLQKQNEISYSLNGDHPAFVDFSNQLSEDLRVRFKKILQIASFSLPISAIYADVGSSPNDVRGAVPPPDTLIFLAKSIYRT